ncbi:hypothetical protein GX50_00614 [[Emmonsia] crescens]|uniref:Uncharacterized protein n=1 Tax=[Emmonsia] crescens TaxID=73230 RepID=A0A2B7ZV03_9EURO|nr:hypothetical protein GX50_00614 [Emmonsia crescens]
MPTEPHEESAAQFDFLIISAPYPDGHRRPNLLPSQGQRSKGPREIAQMAHRGGEDAHDARWWLEDFRRRCKERSYN